MLSYDFFNLSLPIITCIYAYSLIFFLSNFSPSLFFPLYHFLFFYSSSLLLSSNLLFPRFPFPLSLPLLSSSSSLLFFPALSSFLSIIFFLLLLFPYILLSSSLPLLFFPTLSFFLSIIFTYMWNITSGCQIQRLMRL